MGNYLHRETKRYIQSVSFSELPNDIAEYIFMPDMSGVKGISSRYWKIDGDVVSEMSQVEKNIVDSEALTARRDNTIDGMIDNVEGNLRQLVKLMICEINILKAQHGLSNRTMTQFKTQIRKGYGS